MSNLFDITIVKQPQHAIKFRTLSDVKGNRGEIKNREGGKVKIEATFKGADKNLCPQKLKVLVSAFHRDESTLNEYLPSRYSIQKCGSEPREITWDQFEKPMTKVSENPIKFQYELENAFIFAPFEKDHQIPYFNKYSFFNGKYRSYLKRMSDLEETNEFLNQQIEKLKKQCCEDEYKDSVCLRFDVFSEIVGSQKVNSHGCVHSENIDKGVAKFKINGLCNTHIPNDGKGVMFLLLNKKYESGTACLNEEIDADWTVNARIKENYSANNAVSLEMPKKEFNELVRHCSVWLQETKLGKNGLSTPSEEFYYVNVLYASKEQESKRMKFNDNNALLGPGLQFDDTGNGNAAVTKAVFYFAENNGRESSVLITERIEQADYAYHQKNGNGLFHAAMLYNKLSDFLAIGSAVLNKYMANVRNADNETLLHYACKHNKPQYIDDLLKIGCPLDTPCLHTYQTALHTAIYMHHKECLMKFVKLIQAPQRLGVSEKALRRLMLYSDGQGFTVAHAATLNAEVGILDVVLRFCKATNIEILRKRTLTLEFSLLDLAKKSGEEMIKIHISNLLRAEYGVVGNDDESDDDDDAGSCRPMSEMLNLRVGLRNLV